MNKCIFTIVAKNYIGLALILEKSIKRFYDDFDFYIVIADEFDQDVNEENLPHNCVIAKKFLQFSEEIWENMSFKYNLTEFCTSIKPACFLELFNTHEKVIYLDPDILCFSRIDSVFNLLDHYRIVLTPHIIDVPQLGSSDAAETIWLDCGIFNLGFMAAAKSVRTEEILVWWHKRLVEYCFIDTYDSLFTDQKWMNFLPSFLSSDELLITKNKGMNLAPWNFFEREVIGNEVGNYYVKSRNSNSNGDLDLLVFVHYSAYNYNELLEGKISQHGVNFAKSYNDIDSIINVYTQYLNEHRSLFLTYIHKKYSYNYFTNGKDIHLFHRRIFRALSKRGETFDIPFSAEGRFYKLLERRGAISSQQMPIDKLNKNNLSSIDKKLTIVNWFTRMIFKLLGYRNYILFIRLLRSYSRFESQIHLIDKKYSSNNIL